MDDDQGNDLSENLVETLNKQALRFELFKDATAIDKLEAAWDSLCSELANSITVFSSFIWYRTWLDYYSSGTTLHLFTMWHDDRLVGIAPLMRKKATFHGLPVRTVGFIQNNQSLHNDFIVKPEFMNIFLQNLFAVHFEEFSQWDVLFFRNISTSSAGYKPMSTILEMDKRTWNTKSTPYNTPYLKPSGSWADYFAGRTRRSRKTLKNIRNRAHKAGNISVKNISSREDFLSCKEELFDLAKLSWTENVGESLGSPANRNFYEELALRAAAKGWLSIWVLYLNNKMIALEFHLRAYGKEHALRGHYHPEFSSLSPGTFLEMAILKHIFSEENKVQLYDFCGAFDRYKKKWTDTFVPHSDIYVFNKKAYPQFINFQEFTVVPLLKNTLQRIRLLD